MYFKDRIRSNWTQEIRQRNLETTLEFLKAEGGYMKVINSGNMQDFERFLAFKLGCSIKTSQEYIETVRGASLWLSRSVKDLDESGSKNPLASKNESDTLDSLPQKKGKVKNEP